MWIVFKYITIFVNLFSDFFRCEIVSWYFTIFYEMLHANMMSDITESTFVYFSESTMVSMLRLGTFQNSHCASLPGSISAHVSVGQFLGSLLSAHLLRVTVVTSFQFLTTVAVHLYLAALSAKSRGTMHWQHCWHFFCLICLWQEEMISVRRQVEFNLRLGNYRCGRRHT